MKPLVTWKSERVVILGPPRWLVEIGLEKRDAWVGLFWDKKIAHEFARIPPTEAHGWQKFPRLDLYFCPIPFVVIHVCRHSQPLKGAGRHV